MKPYIYKKIIIAILLINFANGFMPMQAAYANESEINFQPFNVIAEDCEICEAIIHSLNLESIEEKLAAVIAIQEEQLAMQMYGFMLLAAWLTVWLLLKILKSIWNYLISVWL